MKYGYELFMYGCNQGKWCDTSHRDITAMMQYSPLAYPDQFGLHNHSPGNQIPSIHKRIANSLMSLNRWWQKNVSVIAVQCIWPTSALTCTIITNQEKGRIDFPSMAIADLRKFLGTWGRQASDYIIVLRHTSTGLINTGRRVYHFTLTRRKWLLIMDYRHEMAH